MSYRSYMDKAAEDTNMPQREFDIIIAPDGGVEVHVRGYKGKSCMEVMKMFEQVVGELKSRGPDQRVLRA